jgi:N-dimethylarginine dimethylaminohydrolase
LNSTVLVSDPQYFGIQEINPYENEAVQPNREALMAEHAAVVAALRANRFTVDQVASPKNCLDGVYTANWAVTKGSMAILANLPAQRSAELQTARAALTQRGYEVIEVPHRYSGQGDTLRVRDDLHIVGHGYRTDKRMVPIIANLLESTVIPLKARPKRDKFGRPVINKLTGWPDSYYYDIDLAVGIIDEHTLVVCFGALTRASARNLREAAHTYGLTLIPVTVREAKIGYGCNLVSNGRVVVMADGAPKLAATLREHGKEVVTLPNTELRKGGGGFRCITLTLKHE